MAKSEAKYLYILKISNFMPRKRGSVQVPRDFYKLMEKCSCIQNYDNVEDFVEDALKNKIAEIKEIFN